MLNKILGGKLGCHIPSPLNLTLSMLFKNRTSLQHITIGKEMGMLSALYPPYPKWLRWVQSDSIAPLPKRWLDSRETLLSYR